jgi:segregation and condensation protein B
MARKKKNQQSEQNDQSSEGKSPDVSSLVANASAALEALMENSSSQMPQTIEEEPAAKTPEAGDDYGLESSAAVIEAETEAEDEAESEVSAAEADADSDGEEISDELAEFGTTGIFTEEEPESFLPEATDEQLEASELESVESVEGTELDAFESAQIEELEFVEDEQLDSIIESVLFASDRPVSLASLKLVFKGTNVKGDKIRRALDRLAVELASGHRGVSLEEVPGGYQLRTKIDNMQFLTRTLKARQFKLSGPALEVLAIVAYKQPLIKHEIDEIRGVESGHLLRALMEKGLVNFEGKSDLPGKPMLYATTKKFLEIFGLRNLKELPTLSQIDELLPEGMTEEEAKPTLSQVTDSMSTAIGSSYSEGEDELTKITDQLVNINTSSDFFEQEKVRQRQKRDADKAQNIREALAMNEEVTTRDRNWLIKYDEALLNGNMDQFTKQDQAEEVQAVVASEVQLEAELTSEDSIEIAFEEEVDGSDEEPTGEAQL